MKNSIFPSFFLHNFVNSIHCKIALKEPPSLPIFFFLNALSETRTFHSFFHTISVAFGPNQLPLIFETRRRKTPPLFMEEKRRSARKQKPGRAKTRCLSPCMEQQSPHKKSFSQPRLRMAGDKGETGNHGVPGGLLGPFGPLQKDLSR